MARSRVETSQPEPVRNAVAWEAVRERLRYHRDAHYDPAAEFVFASPHVPRHPDFLAYAQPSFPPGRTLQEAACDLMLRIHSDFEFEPSATDVGTPALEALRMRKGVCQDFAHIMLGCLRSLDLPGRYVSGYLLTQPPPGQPRLLGSDVSHAWVSVYLPRPDGAGDWAGPRPHQRPGAGGRLRDAGHRPRLFGRVAAARRDPRRRQAEAARRRHRDAGGTYNFRSSHQPRYLMSVQDKLKELGITLPAVSTPAAAYVPFVRTGNLVFLSGHIAKKDGKAWVGQFGKNMTTEQGKAAARAIAIDLMGTLQPPSATWKRSSASSR